MRLCVKYHYVSMIITLSCRRFAKFIVKLKIDILVRYYSKRKLQTYLLARVTLLIKLDLKVHLKNNYWNNFFQKVLVNV